MKKLLFAFVALLAVTTIVTAMPEGNPRSPPVVGADKCTWGPSYWCQNLQTAQECQAVKHCTEKHWT
ncbi:PREDICTED: prosaposin-like [Dinoponera quadriceps]|uniref:Prosaposin-like n=1 Tax=Dinoponera quadriceps TaxID=609295 RepID=A0A6P3Y0G6_DINQU|nr:PREDICTED: prosaposin-like [Dinoponera quadriceps]